MLDLLVGTKGLGTIVGQARPELEGKYLHWDDLRHRAPPEGLSAELWWAGFEIARRALRRSLPLVDLHGESFQFAMTDSVIQLVHGIDRDASGRLVTGESGAINSATRDQYLVSSLIEEAITSSQLEGASTTRQVAAEMLRSGRRPQNRSEQMIFNNFLAMELVRARRELRLTPDFVLELHAVTTDGTLDGVASAGRLRRADEPIVVTDVADGAILHVPPPAAELPRRLEAMCSFANGESPDWFIHPVVRAIVLHFWLAYDHPFVDGNGRTARALFYWSMLASGYWLAEFLSISRILKKAPAKYGRAFLFTETDANDVTYFALHQLRVLTEAIRDLHTYLERKTGEIRELEQRLRRADDLNHRQLALLSHALRHPDAEYTIEGHARSHRVVYQTARTDLMALAAMKHLSKRQRGRAFIFRPAPDLVRRLRPR